MPEKLLFLTSTRFWALILIAIVKVLEGQMIISPDLANALYLIFAGFIGVRTVDRSAEKIGKN